MSDEDHKRKKAKVSEGFDLNGILELATSQLLEIAERKVRLSEERLKLNLRKFDLEQAERNL